MAIRWKRISIGAVFAVVAVAAVIAYFMPNEEERAAARREAEAVAAYQAALPKAYAGDPRAEFEVAEHLRTGNGVERDPVKAAEWYRKAADKAHIGAEYALGTLYENGDGVPKDLAQAAEWYRLAATLGRHPAAEFRLGQMYYSGLGVQNDPAEAIKWYRRAAESGYAAAQYVLGDIYQNGWNVEKDYALAYKWYTLALPHRAEIMAINRKFDPLKARGAMVPKMSKFQIKRGEQWAREWKPVAPPANFVRPGTTLVQQAPPETPTPPDHGLAVRLLALDAPYDAEEKTITVSLILDLADAAERVPACAIAPRVREAVFQALWQQPIRKRGGIPDLKAAEARLVDPVNRVLGKAAVRRVLLFPADRPLDANDLLRTPFDKVAECPEPPPVKKP